MHISLCTGAERTTRGWCVSSGAEQHLHTSGQQEQTPAVHTGFQFAVKTQGNLIQARSSTVYSHTRAFYWLVMNVKGAILRKALPGSAFTKRLILDLS